MFTETEGFPLTRLLGLLQTSGWQESTHLLLPLPGCWNCPGCQSTTPSLAVGSTGAAITGSLMLAMLLGQIYHQGKAFSLGAHVNAMCSGLHPSTCLHSPAGVFIELVFRNVYLPSHVQLRCNICFSVRSWFLHYSTAGLGAEGFKWLVQVQNVVQKLRWD